MTTKQDKACDRLYKAVAAYIEAIGGKAVVIGGVEIQQWPEDRKMTFRLAVKITGRKPVKPEERGG